MKILYYISLLLAVIGSLNWGLIGIAELNLVTLIFGEETLITKFIYMLVGFAGIYLVLDFLCDSLNLKV
jgi:uncharacterized membrane protein YuzA (DUF378 family)